MLCEYLSSRINEFGGNVGADSPTWEVDFGVISGTRGFLTLGVQLKQQTQHAP